MINSSYKCLIKAVRKLLLIMVYFIHRSTLVCKEAEEMDEILNHLPFTIINWKCLKKNSDFNGNWVDLNLSLKLRNELLLASKYLIRLSPSSLFSTIFFWSVYFLTFFRNETNRCRTSYIYCIVGRTEENRRKWI